MGKYAQWEEYGALYPDGLSQKEFEHALPEAEMWIDVLTAGRAQEVPDWAAEQLRAAVCAAVNRIAQREAARGMGGVPLSVVKNQEYTEQYCVQETGDDAVCSAIRRCLSGTGLIGAL